MVTKNTIRYDGGLPHATIATVKSTSLSRGPSPRPVYQGLTRGRSPIVSSPNSPVRFVREEVRRSHTRHPSRGEVRSGRGRSGNRNGPTGRTRVEGSSGRLLSRTRLRRRRESDEPSRSPPPRCLPNPSAGRWSGGQDRGSRPRGLQKTSPGPTLSITPRPVRPVRAGTATSEQLDGNCSPASNGTEVPLVCQSRRGPTPGTNHSQSKRSGREGWRADGDPSLCCPDRPPTPS